MLSYIVWGIVLFGLIWLLVAWCSNDLFAYDDYMRDHPEDKYR